MFLLWLALALAPHSAAPNSAALGEGFWHTRGSQMLDAANHPVRIAGINWYGFETVQAAPGGLDLQDYKTLLQTIKRSGYNTIRIPFSSQMIESPIVPSNIKFTNSSGAINTDLRGLNSLQILDKIVTAAGAQGLKVILDNHCSKSGDGPGSDGLWYTQTYSEAAWIEDWRMLAHRYAADPTVLGFDLRNEPHNAASGGACWGCGSPNDWRLAAERAGNAVLTVNPKLLIFVEGIDAYESDFYWWGGNLMGVRTAPVRLAVPNQLVYSAHDYGPVESTQKWFTPEMSDATLNAVWTKHWAYIAQENIAPVWLGEFGFQTPTSAPADSLETAWFQSLTGLLAHDPRIGWTYWTLNASDRYGLLNPSYDGFSSALRQQALATIQFPLSVGSGTSTRPGAKSSHSNARAYAEVLAPLPLPVANLPSQPNQPTPAQPSSVVSETRPAPSTQPLPQTFTGPLQCHVTFTNINDWHKGFTAGIVLHNTGPNPIQGWALSFNFEGNQKISQLWNGHVDQQGTSVTINNETFNATLSPNAEQAGIGFNATYEGTNRLPSAFYLNGTLCK